MVMGKHMEEVFDLLIMHLLAAIEVSTTGFPFHTR